MEQVKSKDKMAFAWHYSKHTFLGAIVSIVLTIACGVTFMQVTRAPSEVSNISDGTITLLSNLCVCGLIFSVILSISFIVGFVREYKNCDWEEVDYFKKQTSKK